MLLFLQPLLRGVQIHAAVVLAANHAPPTLTVKTPHTALDRMYAARHRQACVHLVSAYR